MYAYFLLKMYCVVAHVYNLSSLEAGARELGTQIQTLSREKPRARNVAQCRTQW